MLGLLAALALVAATRRSRVAVAGDRAARVAAVLSAVMASSVALAAVFTPAELLASVPACASIGCLVAAHRGGRTRWLVGAGLLAVAAALIKQSFLDAGFAGRDLPDREQHPRPQAAAGWPAAYAAGALIPLAVVGVWLLPPTIRPAAVYALFGFRIHALHALSASAHPLTYASAGSSRGRCVRPVGRRGRAAAALGAARRPRDRRHARRVARRRRVRRARRRQLLAALPDRAGRPRACWSRAALAPGSRAAVVAALAALATNGASVAGVIVVARGAPRSVLPRVARYVRAHARPGDTQYVMYARANPSTTPACRSPYPYGWSLIVRAPSPAPRPVLRHLLRSPAAPDLDRRLAGPERLATRPPSA